MIKTKRLKPLTVLKCVGPKVVPFFKTVAIFFVLYGMEEATSLLFCLVKVLPVLSLMGFVLYHGMSLDAWHRYSRRVLFGLAFSVLGDIFLVWKHAFVNFELGLLSFAIAQLSYARAFGLRPLKLRVGLLFALVGLAVWWYLQPGLKGPMVYLAPCYISLISCMAWRAVARVTFYGDLWTWTKLCGCIGAVSFMISDLTIAINMFAVSVPFSHQIIMATYYLAQFGISLSVVDSQADELVRAQCEEEGIDEEDKEKDKIW